jgi:hypothetical protein
VQKKEGSYVLVPVIITGILGLFSGAGVEWLRPDPPSTPAAPPSLPLPDGKPYGGTPITAKVTYLTDIEPYHTMKPYIVDNNGRRTPMTIAGQTYSKGASFSTGNVTAVREVRWNLHQDYSTVVGLIGIDDSASDGYSSALVTLFQDGKQIKQYRLKKGNPAERIELDVTGVGELSMTVHGVALVNLVDITLIQDTSSAKVKPSVQPMYLTTLEPFQSTLKFNVDNDGLQYPMSMTGNDYSKGIQLYTAHTTEVREISWNLGGKYTNLTGLLGADDKGAVGKSATVTIYVDGEPVMGPLTVLPGNGVVTVNEDLTGAQVLKVTVQGLGKVNLVNANLQ